MIFICSLWPMLINTAFGVGQRCAAIQGLARRGHQLLPVSDWFVRMGHAHAVSLHDGTLRGGADPLRRRGRHRILMPMRCVPCSRASCRDSASFSPSA